MNEFMQRILADRRERIANERLASGGDMREVHWLMLVMSALLIALGLFM